MTRQLRILYGDAIYHVTSRGNGGEDVFLCEEDRLAFLGLLDQITGKYGFNIYTYCLMDNHFHLILATPRANLPDGMRQLNGVYSQGFNQRYKRRGHLFQGRYDARLIENETYLAEAARYVLLNPMRAGIVKRIGDWRWSSYRAMSGLDPVPTFLKAGVVLSLFGNEIVEARKCFMEFVAEGIGMGSPFIGTKGDLILGDEVSIKALGSIPGNLSNEIPSKQRNIDRPSLENIFSGAGKEEGSYQAVYLHGYRLREVGEYLGLHYSVISRMVKRFEQSVNIVTDSKIMQITRPGPIG